MRLKCARFYAFFCRPSTVNRQPSTDLIPITLITLITLISPTLISSIKKRARLGKNGLFDWYVRHTQHIPYSKLVGGSPKGEKGDLLDL